jgi:hypothetical protein
VPTPDTIWTYLAAITVFLVVLAVPGGLIGVAAGLRGWALAGLAPLLSYAVIGLAGPWLHFVKLPFDVWTAAAFTALIAGAAYGLRRFGLRRGEPAEAAEPVVWSRRAHLAVLGCVLIASALSVYVFVAASHGPDEVIQRWDTVFHANGIRYIADTGDGGLYGMSTINWYDPGGAQFYPNAFHLVGALVYSLSGAMIPTVLNVLNVPIAAVFALAMVALIRQFGGRAAFAGAAAVISAAATTGAYESVSSGLQPYALCVVLTPLAAVAVQRFLAKPGFDSGTVLALSAVGLLAVHSSALFGGIVFSAALLVQRWVTREGKVGRDLLRLLPVMAAAVVVAAPMVLGAIGVTSSGYPYTPWASHLKVPEALSELVQFREVLPNAQTLLSVLLVLGVLSVWTLRRMRWVLASGVLISAMFVAIACFGDLPWVVSFSRPWWNDRYRLMALAAIPLCLLAAHGVAEIHRWLGLAASRWAWLRSKPGLSGRLAVVGAVLMLVVGGLLSNGFYAKSNETAVSYAYDNGWPGATELPISKDELTAMYVLEKMGIGPDEKVLNDRIDGSAWLYAITGIHPVAGHYDPGVQPKDAAYLALHFRDYDTDPEVRAAVKRLDIHHVLLGHGAISPELRRAPGIANLDGLDFLRRDYSNPHAVIYTIIK